MSERIILHSDANCFYASVEMLLNPDLRGKAVAVCGSTEERHGIVLAKSELAKKSGVKTGMANWEARQACPGLIVVPPQYDQYCKFSKLLRNIYLRYTDLVEPYGMDECWLDVTHSRLIHGDGIKIAEEIRSTVKEELGLTVSIVSSFAEATDCDKSQLLQNFTAYIAQYDDTNAVKPRLSVSVGIYGYDLAAYRKFVAQNPIEVQGIVRLGDVYDNPSQALADTQTRFWKDGVEIPASAVPEDMLTADKVAVLDEDGTLHVLITPEVTGNPEAIESAAAPLAEKSVPVQAFGGFSTHDWGWLNDLVGSDVFERMDWLTLDLSAYAKNVKGTWADWRLIGSNVADYNNRINQEFDPETTAGLQTYVAEMVAAILSGQDVSEEDMAHLQSVISLATGRSVSDITVASVAITGDDGSSKSLTLSQEVLTAALSSEGYTESAPGLFASMSFNTANNYTITFTIGDAYDKAVFSVLIARSFANMHLSGVPTGGVAFGKFSSAQPDQPLFECAYPIVLIGSVVYGSSSAMPANPVEGQLYFVVE